MTVKTRCQRRAPFLHRNWIKGARALKDSAAMGNIVSSPIHKASHQVDHDGGRPLKRRRISSPDSLDVDHLIASPQTSDSRSALRVEVLKIFHKDSKKVRSYHAHAVPREVMPTKASCRITISELTSGCPRVVHCQSQVCDLTTFKNPVGPHRVARIDLPRPFFIPQESILVNRVDDGRFDLADSYDIAVELEAAHGGHWPPLDSSDFGFPLVSSSLSPVPGKAWVLSSRFDKIFGRQKGSLSLSAGYSAHEPPFHTDYLMDVDLRWTAGFKALKRLEKGSMACINAVDPDSDPFGDEFFAPSRNGRANGINGHHVDESSVEMDEEGLDGPEGPQTPSRSLRAREKNKVYNLKVLSDQAQGRERKRRSRANHVATNEGRVSYLLPSDQPVCLDYYRCVACGVYHQTMQQLQVHLQTFHTAYDYVLETTSQGPQFRVTSRCEPMSSPFKQFQMKPPVKPFSLETFLVGDQSWVSSRLGPDTIDDVFTFPRDKNIYERLPSRSPASTQPRPVQRRPAVQKSDRVLVPRINQPLFDPISRARLIPGQEVPKRILDSTWLIQKHRESTSDFSDVTPAEKEYIWEWDGYILRQSITSAAYFPRAWLGFVREKASWLAAADQRLLEFGKHASLLRVRDMLSDGIIMEAFAHINDARARLQPGVDDGGGNLQTEESDPKQSPRATEIRKGANGCTICQLPVLGPRTLVCSNKDAAMSVGKKENWLCNACYAGRPT
ncbi:hypothetical protein Trco_006686 [Trichoderma cornu-damae]|uniref:Polycomb protein VEFS-Box domain-containing protein n=1 Tax=Trichoderma cornu-damae TaxID=654480 RepID=A0A9P8QHB6_9HYPO|nr:hypothetical protein Trco_006686 [Trichoderma cornu-damae]